jgi:dTDP-4-amino-4,6-dideoxygalactose transaminase
VRPLRYGSRWPSGVGFRQWYGGGLLAQPCFRDAPHDRLDVTARLAPLLIGLPVAPDLSDHEIDRIAGALERGATSAPVTAA